MSGELDPVYVRARHTLLDALEALREHLDAIVLVGAQAIYLHTGDAELSVAPYTTDGDIAIDPTVLKPDPKLEMAMRLAGFARSDQLGTWIATQWNISIGCVSGD